MSSPHAVLSASLLPPRGEQRPRLLCLPEGIASTAAGEDAAELAASAGLVLDDWQRFLLVNGMAETEAARWAAFEVMVTLSRQNGKNGTVLARELAGLFTLKEDLIIHTAHKFNACALHYRKVKALIKGSPHLLRHVKRNGFKDSHGNEGIELRPTPALIIGSDSRLVTKSAEPQLLFFARSSGNARSFSCDCLVWDEDMYLTDAEVGDAMPTLSAMPNPQIWLLGSAGNRKSVVQGRIRSRAVKAITAASAGLPPGQFATGFADGLMMAEWSIWHCTDECERHCRVHDDPASPASWAKANPGKEIRITEQYMRREMQSMAPGGVRVWPPDTFSAERLGVGDYPPDEEAWLVISAEAWAACLDAGSPRPDPRIAVAADATPDGLTAAVGIAGLRGDGRMVIEIPEGDHRPGEGLSWVVPRLKELKAAHRPCATVIDPRGPAAPLIDEAEKAGLEIVKPTTMEVAQAFGQFRKDATSRPPKLVHTGQVMLRTALAGAESRVIGDGAQAWARKDATVDICPLVAVTMAAWASGKFGRPYDPLKSVAGPS
jgi:hypothetical protein